MKGKESEGLLLNATTLRLRETELRWTERDGEVVVRDERRSMSYTLNHSAAVIWVKIAEGAATPELVEALCEEYGVDTDTATEDVERFIAALEDYALLESD